MKHKHGFTLIELMIVIAIIAILASILVPSFLKAKAQSQLTACVENLRNISIAVEMYKTEQGDFPVSWSSGIAKLVPNYIKSWPECPSSAADYVYARGNSLGGSYTKDDFCIYCPGVRHKGAGITTSDRPMYMNSEGWYIRN